MLRSGAPPSRLALPLLVALTLVSPTFASAQGLAPDVRAVAVSSPEVAVEGARFTITSTFSADAGGASATFRWSAYLTADGALDGAIPLGTFGPLALQPGERRVVSESVAVPRGTTGFFTVAVLADSASALSEPNEFDNLARAPSRLRVRARRADVALLSASTVEREVRPGARVRVSFSAENRGELAADFELVAFAGLDAGPSTADVPLGSTGIRIAAGARVDGELEGLIPLDVATGRWTVAVIGDPEGVRVEGSEIDNVAIAPEPLLVFRDDLQLVTTSLPEGTAGFDYHTALMASGGDGQFRFRLASGVLPEGLALDAATGIIEGRPLSSGTSTVTVEVESRNLVASAELALRISNTGAPLRVVSERVADAALGLPYEEALVASGGEPPYTWAADPSALPPGLSLSAAGLLSGAPTTPGRFTFEVAATDRLGARAALTLTIDVAPAVSLIIRDSDPPPTPVGVPLDHPLEVAGGVPPYRWTALSAMPAGLTLTEQGRIVGVPAAIGRFAVLVRASDATRTGARDSRLIHILIEDDGALVLTTESLPRAGLRAPYVVPLAASGGTAPLEWSIVRGDSAPPGFFLQTADDGEVSIRGTAIRAFAHGFGIEVRDAVGRRARRMFILEAVRPEELESSGCSDVHRGDHGTPRGLLFFAVVVGVLGRRRLRRGMNPSATERTP